MKILKKIFHAISRSQQGSQRDLPSIKTLRSYENINKLLFFPQMGIESTTYRIYNHTLVLLRQDWPQK